MKTIHLIWILCQYVIIVESRTLIFSSAPVTWFYAEQKCKNEYNGYLAGIDEIKEGKKDKNFARCLNGSNVLWVGEVLYTTGYIHYKGCYSFPNSIRHNSMQMENITIAICHLQCRYEKGFAIKQKFCKCLGSESSISSHTVSHSQDCSFICSDTNCGFYGGKSAISVYTNDQTSPSTTPADLCIANKCIRQTNGPFQVVPEKIMCENQSKVAAQCDDGNKKDNVGSWNDAMRFCGTQNSLLSTVNDEECQYDLRLWQIKRIYQQIITSKDTTITHGGNTKCISTVINGMQRTPGGCYKSHRFVCVTGKVYQYNNAHPIQERECEVYLTDSKPTTTTGTINATGSNGEHVSITSFRSTDKHVTGNDGLTSRTGTHIVSTQNSSTMTSEYAISGNRGVQSESKISKNNTPTIVGVSVGLTCVIAVGVLLIFIYWKRNGFGFCKPNIKTPKDNHTLDKLSISGNHARANAFGKTVEIDQNSNVDNDCSSEAEPAIYALPMRKQGTPEPDTVCVDKETLGRARSFHYDLAEPTRGHYDVNESYRESSTDDYYVTKAESDYDRLHQRRDKLLHYNMEDDYSHCLPGDDEYSYSRARDEGTRTNLDEDEYSHLASIKEEGFYDKCQR